MADDYLPDLPPASERQGGRPDGALERLAGAKMLRERAQGMTYDQIAKENGYSNRSGARNAIMRAIDRHEVESARELRIIENLRLDTDERALRVIIGSASTPAAVKVRAVAERTRISAARSRLNGLSLEGHDPAQVEAQINTATLRHLAAGVEAMLDHLDVQGEKRLAAIDVMMQTLAASTHDGVVYGTTEEPAS